MQLVCDVFLISSQRSVDVYTKYNTKKPDHSFFSFRLALKLEQVIKIQIFHSRWALLNRIVQCQKPGDEVEVAVLQKALKIFSHFY